MSFFVSDTFRMELSWKPPMAPGENMDSGTFLMKNHYWHIKSFVKEEKPGYLQAYLHCEETSDLYEIKVNFSFKLISAIGKDHDILRGPSTYTFTCTLGRGWSNLVSLSDLKDKEKGLMKSGYITLQLDATFD